MQLFFLNQEFNSHKTLLVITASPLLVIICTTESEKYGVSVSNTTISHLPLISHFHSALTFNKQHYSVSVSSRVSELTTSNSVVCNVPLSFVPIHVVLSSYAVWSLFILCSHYCLIQGFHPVKYVWHFYFKLMENKLIQMNQPMITLSLFLTLTKN